MYSVLKQMTSLLCICYIVPDLYVVYKYLMFWTVKADVEGTWSPALGWNFNYLAALCYHGSKIHIQ